MDILLDLSTNDCVFVNGECPVTETAVDHVAQRLQIKLQTFKGEWFNNILYGVPYFQEILGKKVSKSRVDIIFQEAILEEQGVAELLSFSSSLNNRQYSLEFKVRATNSSIVSVSLDNIGV
tara:strand:+ start:38627 stop:38989 length:363 start_codon:yes stop_codon:yes gene_type:complete